MAEAQAPNFLAPVSQDAKIQAPAIANAKPNGTNGPTISVENLHNLEDDSEEPSMEIHTLPEDQQVSEYQKMVQDHNAAAERLASQSLQEQKRIFEERTAKLLARVEEDIWDTEAWISILMEAQSKSIEAVRDVYERFLKAYPTAGRYWKLYVEQELVGKNYQNIDKIFTRCLLKCPNIDLWKCYVNYIEVVRKNQPDGKEQIAKAYEFALNRMSLDISCTQLWLDYLNFLKEFKPQNQYEEGQKITALRKVYQRAIETPMHNLEAVWNEYNQFENDLNKTLAKPLLAEHSGKYMNARTVFREKKRYYEGILRNMLARPPGHGKGAEKESHQVALWKRLITHEKANPQRLESAALKTRIEFTYDQCLLNLYRYPEIWYEYANYETSLGNVEAAVAIYERALEALPDCLIVYFAYADMLESHKNFKAVKDIYEKLLKQKEDPLIYVEYMKFVARTEGVKNIRPIFRRGRNSPKCSYQIYVASALMEWHFGKDSTVARNIFDWGMNKYSSEPAFVLEYLKFLTSLNEENNIRVLFERAVTVLPPEKAREIWNLYLAFEQNYGNQETILKIQKRKAEKFPESEPSGIFQVVNRYKYLDLWPCNKDELESFSREILDKDDPSDGLSDESGDPLHPSKFSAKLSRFPKPDLSQMVPFTPEIANTIISPFGPNIPDFITQFIVGLPSATAYQGPIPNIDLLLSLLADTPLPPPPEGAQVLATSTPTPSVEPQKKRKQDEEDEDEEEQPTTVNAPPSKDLFRARQAAKLSKKKL